MKSTKNTLFQFAYSLMLVLGVAGISYAQEAAISGTIYDENSGETLIGANIVVEGTTTGTSTDFDGKYQFQVEPGTYTLVATYIGYNEKKIEGVEVKAGETTVIDVALSDEAVDLGVEVVVTAQVVERTENALLMLQKKSDKIQDGISAQEISRLGAGDAASALRKVTGTTIVDGKYVYVRGLGDRYSATSLNGIRLPSIDPYRNSAQLDIIPSNFLDNIIASKTFTPDLPGDFTGGSVDIKTKSLPERFTFNISLSTAYNTLASFEENFLTFDAGDLAWLGYNDGFLDRPAVLGDEKTQGVLNRTAPFQAPNNDEIAGLIDDAIRSMNQQFHPGTKTSFMDYSISASVGNQFDLGGKPLGLLLTMNYDRGYSYYDDGISANYQFTGSALVPNFNLSDQQAVETPELGGLFGLSYKTSPTDEIRFLTIYSHSTDISTRLLRGDYLLYGFVEPTSEFQSRALHFRERELIDYILSGDHAFEGLNNTKLEWSLSLVDSRQEEPDLRFFANNFNLQNGSYGITLAAYDPPGHFFRQLEDQTIQGKIDLTIPFLQAGSKANKLKFGGSYYTKERDFNEEIYSIDRRSGERYEGTNAYFEDDNIGIIDQENGLNTIGLYLFDQTRAANSYSGEFTVWAGYGMLTYSVTDRLKFIGGARIEGTDIFVDAFFEEDNAEIDEVDILPAANFVYALTEEMNLRASYSNTLARPNMREVAAFASFGFIGDPILFGNPDLVRTRIDNFDIRYEFFPRSGEVFAVSGFYKEFEDPIVQTFRPAGNPQFTFKNANTATLYGAELEVRKDLDFMGPALSPFGVSANLAYIFSESDLDSVEIGLVRDVDPDFPDTRPFIGQSEFVANVNLTYTNTETGWDGILAFNYFSDRLSSTGVEGTPDVYERGRGTLDFSLTKTINRVQLKFRARNLLNPAYETYLTFLDEEFINTSFKRGQEFSFGISYGL